VPQLHIIASASGFMKEGNRWVGMFLNLIGIA